MGFQPAGESFVRGANQRTKKSPHFVHYYATRQIILFLRIQLVCEKIQHLLDGRIGSLKP